MKKGLLLVVGCWLVVGARAQWVSIPDTNFGNFLNTWGYTSCLQGNNSIGWQMDTTCPEVVNETDFFTGSNPIKDITGIQYFDSLTFLNCSGSGITFFPPLPAGITTLWCGGNLLSNLPNLPVGLTNLICDGNRLSTLPALPSGLTYLSCRFNQLVSLPPLPAGLTYLDCSYNALNSLPDLPAELYELTCDSNQLTSLPELPLELDRLNCQYNQLSSLPVLPTGLTLLQCFNNQLTSLPALPNGLIADCSSNLINSLPPFPDSLRYFFISNNPIHCFPPLKRIYWLKFSNTNIICITDYGDVTLHYPNLYDFPLCFDVNPNPCDSPSAIGASYELRIIQLSPNPATTHLTIQLQQTPSSSTAFQLFDITGRMILQKPLSDKTNSMDVSGVSKRIYLYSVVSEGENARAGKLIIE